jgi:hypothetical protein
MIIIEHLIGQLKEGYDIILFAMIFAQEGILSPQIITPGCYKSFSRLPFDSSMRPFLAYHRKSGLRTCIDENN